MFTVQRLVCAVASRWLVRALCASHTTRFSLALLPTIHQVEQTLYIIQHKCTAHLLAVLGNIILIFVLQTAHIITCNVIC